MAWTVFENGKSLGTTGSERGTIRRDEELNSIARITLEQGGVTAPWSITAGIYGWMAHTRFFGSQDESNRQFDQMKIEMEKILAIIPNNNDVTPEATSTVCSAIEAFVRRFD